MRLSEDCKYCSNFYCTHCWHCRHITHKDTDGDYCCRQKDIVPNYKAYVYAMRYLNRLSEEDKQEMANAFSIPKDLLWIEDEIEPPEGDWVVPNKEPL